jgi:hypothetical protein
MSNDMASWELKLSRVVAPMHTLSDARAYILSLPPGTRHQDDWQRAADLLMVAVDSASETDIEQATFQLERALVPQAARSTLRDWDMVTRQSPERELVRPVVTAPRELADAAVMLAGDQAVTRRKLRRLAVGAGL